MWLTVKLVITNFDEFQDANKKTQMFFYYTCDALSKMARIGILLLPNALIDVSKKDFKRICDKMKVHANKEIAKDFIEPINSMILIIDDDKGGVSIGCDNETITYYCSLEWE